MTATTADQAAASQQRTRWRVTPSDAAMRRWDQPARWRRRARSAGVSRAQAIATRGMVSRASRVARKQMVEVMEGMLGCAGGDSGLDRCEQHKAPRGQTGAGGLLDMPPQLGHNVFVEQDSPHPLDRFHA